MAELDDVISDVRERVAAVNNLNPADFPRTGDLGSLNFEPAVPVLIEIQKLTSLLSAVDYRRVPLPRLKDLQSPMKALMFNLDKMRGLQLSQAQSNIQNLQGERDNYLRSISDQWAQIYDAVAKIVAVQMPNMSEAAVAAKRAEEAAAKAIDFEGQAQTALKQVQAAASTAGASKEAIHFEKEAHRHRRAAIRWLITSSILAVIVVGLALLFYFHPLHAKPDATWEVVQGLGAKVILLSVFSFLLVFTVRNYSTSRHNFIVNQHRAVALTTFENFVKGTSDDKTKNEILEAAAKSVFSPQISGYLRKGDLTFPLLDWIKFTAGGK